MEETAEELYEDAPCGYLTTRPDGVILRVNRTFERWTGHSREALVGRRRFQDLLAPGARIYHETHYAPLLRMQDAVREIAVDVVAEDGRRLPMLLNSILRRDEHDQPHSIRTTLFDATDRRRYERELLLERRRAETLQAEAALLADVARDLDQVTGVHERALRLIEVLQREQGDAVCIRLSGNGTFGDDPEALTLAEGAAAGGNTERSERALAVPLRVRGVIVGAVGLSRAYPVTDDDVRLLEAVAGRAAVALENARLYEHEREVAHALQQSMLPEELPEDPRLALTVHYAPAVAALEVGGDFYDAFRLGDGRIALLVGDVVGRGLVAASAMGQLRSAARALGGAELGPAAVLHHLDAFVDQVRHGQYATLVYAEVDPANRRLRYACAGHPPPLLAVPGETPVLLWDGRSAPLGARAQTQPRPQAERELPPGARLLLYTDGLVERRGEAIDRDLARLVEVFSGHAATPLERLGPLLAEELLDAGALPDDVCMLCAEFMPVPGFTRVLDAHSRGLAQLRADLRDWLEVVDVECAADRDAIVLACSEAVANAIEHGYGERSGDVAVSATLAAGAVTLEVRDEGSWKPRRPSGSRGRGLLIIEHLMDALEIDPHGGTTVTMRRALGKEAVA